MKYLMLVCLLGALLGGSGCRVSDVRELAISVPAMTSEADVARIKQALAPLNGINREAAVFDTATKTIKVSYDSMVIAHKNIEIAIAEAGYDANGISAIKPAP